MFKKIAALLLISVIFCSFFLMKKKENPRYYLTEKTAVRDIVQFVTATGTLKPKDMTQFLIGSLVAGKVSNIFKDNNDPVSKDEVLAIIDNGIGDSEVKRIKAQLEQAQATYAYQKLFYKRQEELFKAQQLSKNQFDLYTQDYCIAQHKVDELAAALEAAQKIYENLFIRSPDKGIIIQKNIDLGQAITAQLQANILFIIIKDLKDLQAWIDVDESDVGLVADKQEASFTVDAFPKRIYSSTVRRVEYLSKVNDNISTYSTILDIRNEDLSLRPGMTTNVDIKVADTQKAISISNKALRINTLKLEEIAKKANMIIEKLPTSLFEKGTQTRHQEYLWIEENNQLIKQVAVTLGATNGKHTEIKAGVAANQNIIVELIEQPDTSAFMSTLFSSNAGVGRS